MKNGSWSITGAMYNLSIRCSLFLLCGRKLIIYMYLLLFVVHLLYSKLHWNSRGETPLCFFCCFFFFASILVVWNFFRVSWKIIKYNWAITFLFFWWKCKKLLLPICLYVVCLIRNCKLKKLFFTLVLPNCNFWMLICVNMRVFQISLKVLHHRHLQWFVLWQKKL